MDPVKVNEMTERELRVAWKDRWGVFFFLGNEDRRELFDLAGAAGMRVEHDERLDPGDPTSEVAKGRWGPVWGSSRVTQFAFHRCFEIYFSENELLELEDGYADREYPLEEDPYWPVAQLFRQACEAIGPEVAFMVSSSTSANSEIVDRELYSRILEFMPERLFGFPYGLLYLEPDRARIEAPTSKWGMTEIPVRQGKLLFSRYKPFRLQELTDAMEALEEHVDADRKADRETHH